MNANEEYKTCAYCCHQQYHEDGYVCRKDGIYMVYKGDEAMRCKQYKIGDIYEVALKEG